MPSPRNPDSEQVNRLFSNSFLIGFNAYVFIMDFGVLNAGGEIQVHSRIVTSPADAQELSRLLQECLCEHLKEFGRIKKETKHERLHRYPSGH
jgi:Protein of unknown function (DUF3467)